jgi:gem associated protein 5
LSFNNVITINSSFREAIALAKVRLSPFDPVLEDLYTLWAQQLTKDGNYEQAAKW